MNFQYGSCTFCGACEQVCKYGALSRALETPWGLRASIGEVCLSTQGITCRSCGDACAAGAIRFRLELAGRARPVIDETHCNGCGSCVAVCPNRNIQIRGST